MGPVHSWLPAGANIIAQALLSDPTIRGLRANALAARFHLPTSDAREAIGAIVGMIQRTSKGDPTGALRPEPSLGSAVGPFMALDDAMSRYGANMAPIVRSPTPQPSAYFQPDFAADRQASAGRLWEAGAPADDLAQALGMLTSFYAQNPCTVDPAGIVGAFQIAYNAQHSPPLVVDDKYGPKTAAAVASVNNGTAPPSCYPASSPAGPGTLAVPVTTITGNAPAPATSSSPTTLAGMPTPSSPWLLALGAGAAGLFLLSRSKRRPRWMRAVKL